MNDTTRIEYFDIAKGIGIYLVIIGHCIINVPIKNFIYIFHIPIFFFISGYIFKQTNTKALLAKSLKRLIIPYIITCFIILILKSVHTYVCGGNILNEIKNCFYISLYGSGESHVFLGKSISSVGPIWFLLCTFWTRIIFNFVLKLNNKVHKIYIILIMTLIGFILPKIIWLPLSIETSFIAIVYYYCGYYVKENIHKEKYNRNTLIICIIIMCIAAFFTQSIFSTNIFNMYYINLFLGMLGVYCVLYYSRLLTKTKIIRKIFEFGGKNSLLILCVHSIDRKCFASFLPYKNDITNIIRGLIVAMLLCSVAIIIKRYAIFNILRKEKTE